MPIYEYQCKECGEYFERFQKISDKPESKCPKCGKDVKRLISQTSFTLKGQGWYKDGYSGNNESKKSGSDSCESSTCKSCPHKTTDKKN